ncbi:hypothetical protein ANOM_006987 [Aspergillus nomiae NRRL 13137]|uniref:PD-(D/E)XK nuclease-like domain-containing protein n=1 Tax=Aspergillus nomiae NRRL (strain ATCC 15546 / NRRL 13137 / CBS 260.88 / M93) TaxID=1509407 RepID=A0A0L1IZT2_ASPN3|nr:uncharacterized protein ANOM_006987 [Aspergillus nomiae NRRL 13137]KNG84678.1 hypothetical protein ANOM_006987 [Aspergillus nomiae NRRL 13137]
MTILEQGSTILEGGLRRRSVGVAQLQVVKWGVHPTTTDASSALRQDKIYKEDPEGAVDVPDFAWDDTTDWTSGQLEALWEDVIDIYREAAECDEHGQDENAWGTGVILQVLRRGLKRHPTLQVKPVSVSRFLLKPLVYLLIFSSRQTQAIDHSLLPRTPHQVLVNKKIDFTIAFALRDRRVKAVYDAFISASPDQTVSQTTDPFTKRVALFSGTEVKQSDGSSMEALVQLSIWLAAGLEKLLQLRNLQGQEFDLLPTVGWTVIGHEWNLYVAFRGCFEGQDRIYIDGPTEVLSATTRTYYGIFKLIDLVHRVSVYAEEVYWPWLSAKILMPLNTAGH